MKLSFSVNSALPVEPMLPQQKKKKLFNSSFGSYLLFGLKIEVSFSSKFSPACFRYLSAKLSQHKVAKEKKVEKIQVLNFYFKQHTDKLFKTKYFKSTQI